MASEQQSWNVLIASIAVTFIISKWVARKAPYLIAPLMVFWKFLVDKYATQINACGDWIKARLKNAWKFIRGRPYAQESTS